MKFRRKKPITLKDVTIVDDSQLRKVITAAALGNGMEWFDFGVYGYLATSLGKIFFPDANSGLQLIATLATFSVPFFIRPLGGLFFGILGDKYGRQSILSITIILMSLSTFGIGLIPSYSTIGYWAPILLLLCKMTQGFSTGGEYTGASIFMAEYSPDRRRGFMGSFLEFGTIFGYVAGAGLVELMTSIFGNTEMLSWGWRIPFLVALPLGMVGIYLRSAIEETPSFQQHVERLEQGDREGLQTGPSVSFLEIAKTYWPSLLTCTGLVLAMNVTYYMLLTYLPSYLTHNLHYTESRGLLIITVVMICMLFVQPIVGLLSDRIGRRPFIILGSLGLLALSIPAFHWIGSGIGGLAFVGILVLAIALNCFTGVTASTLPALFPTEVRYSALAGIFNIAVLIAGLTPTVVAWLVQYTNNSMVPAYYLMVAGGIGLVTAFMMRETANKPLQGDTPTASDLKEAKELLKEHHEGIEQRIEEIEKEIKRLQKRRSQLILQHPHIEE